MCWISPAFNKLERIQPLNNYVKITLDLNIWLACFLLFKGWFYFEYGLDVEKTTFAANAVRENFHERLHRKQAEKNFPIMSPEMAAG